MLSSHYVKALRGRNENELLVYIYIRAVHFHTCVCVVGWDSSVGIATRYGLDGPGIESWWRIRFSVPLQPGRGPHPTSNAMDSGSFTGVKRPGCGVDHPHPPGAEVKERLEL